MPDVQTVSVPSGAPFGELATATEAPLHNHLWEMHWRWGVSSAHVLPGELDIPRLKDAMTKLSSLYPVATGRFRSRKLEDGRIDHYIALTGTPMTITIETSDSTSPPFATPAIVQPTLSPYVPEADFSKSLDNPDFSLFTVKVTRFPKINTTVLGLLAAHVIMDAAAFCDFSHSLSKLYEGAAIEDCLRPTFSPHINIFTPTPEVLAKWEIPQLYPSFEVADAWGQYAELAKDTAQVQVTFASSEVKIIKSLARGPGKDKWVSEGDALTSYWVNILRLCGEPIDSSVYTINYRNLIANHPDFPSNLPTLVANVSQMHSIPFPSHDPSLLSLRPIARAIRDDLELLKSNPERSLEWLSCRAYRMTETFQAGKLENLMPRMGEAQVNSNARYDWNIPFGFPPSETAYHTGFSLLNFLRVFKTNSVGENGEKGTECTWKMRSSAMAKMAEELIQRDRKEGWARWK